LESFSAFNGRALVVMDKHSGRWTPLSFRRSN
jgi:hypothetical protein